VRRNQEGARLVRPDAWNEVTVRMEGEPARIRVWMNDRLLTDFQHSVWSKNSSHHAASR